MTRVFSVTVSTVAALSVLASCSSEEPQVATAPSNSTAEDAQTEVTGPSLPAVTSGIAIRLLDHEVSEEGGDAVLYFPVEIENRTDAAIITDQLALSLGCPADEYINSAYPNQGDGEVLIQPGETREVLPRPVVLRELDHQCSDDSPLKLLLQLPADWADKALVPGAPAPVNVPGWYDYIVLDFDLGAAAAETEPAASSPGAGHTANDSDGGAESATAGSSTPSPGLWDAALALFEGEPEWDGQSCQDVELFSSMAQAAWPAGAPPPTDYVWELTLEYVDGCYYSANPEGSLFDWNILASIVRWPSEVVEQLIELSETEDLGEGQDVLRQAELSSGHIETLFATNDGYFRCEILAQGGVAINFEVAGEFAPEDACSFARPFASLWLDNEVRP